VNCFRKRLFSRRRLKSAAAVLSLCPILALTSCKSSSSEVEAAKPTSDQASQAEPQVMTVQIAKPVWRKIQRTAQGQGALFAKESVILATKMPGYVSTVLVDFGDRVKTGQVLVEIEREDVAADGDEVIKHPLDLMLLLANAEHHPRFAYEATRRLHGPRLQPREDFSRSTAAAG